VICFLISAFLALDTNRSFSSVSDVAKVWLPFLAGITLIKGEKEWRPLLWTIVLSQGYVGFEQNLNYLVKGYNSAQEGFGGMDNNFFGLALVTTIGPALALALTSKRIISRGLAALSTALILHTTLLTFSRGAMVGLLAVGVVMFALMPKKPAYIAGVVIVALLAARLTGPQLLARYGTTFASEEERDGSAESRVDLWKDCFKVIQRYPVFGVGPANWRTIASSFGWPEGKSAHSVWMETAAEIGLPGVLALFCFFSFTALKLVPVARMKQTPETRLESGAALGVILGITGFMVSGQFVSAPALEVAYYVSLVGLGILKNRRPAIQTDAVGDINRAWRPATRAPQLQPAAAASARSGTSFGAISPRRSV